MSDDERREGEIERDRKREKERERAGGNAYREREMIECVERQL